MVALDRGVVGDYSGYTSGKQRRRESKHPGSIGSIGSRREGALIVGICHFSLVTIGPGGRG